MSGVSGLSAVSGVSGPFGDSGISGVSGISEVSGAIVGLLTSFVTVERVGESSDVPNVGSTVYVALVVALGLSGRATGSSLAVVDGLDDGMRVVRELGAVVGTSVVSGTSLLLLGLLTILLGEITDVLEAEVLIIGSSALEVSCDVVVGLADDVSRVLDGWSVESCEIVLVLVSVLVSGSGSSST